MSLKAFHIVFVTASILLAVLFAVWSLVNYFHSGALPDLLFGLGSLVVAVALVFYERYALKKLKNISYLSVLASLSLAPQPARACAACFGQSDSPLAEGMNMGILSLLLVVVFVLGGIAAFFVYLMKRSAAAAASETV